MHKFIVSVVAITLLASISASGQRGAVRSSSANRTVYGDVKIDTKGSRDQKPMSLDVLLYAEGGNLITRQTVSGNGRYRFINLNATRYVLVVEVENKEIARYSVDLSSPLIDEVKQDIELEMKANPETTTSGVVSAAEIYNRSAGNEANYRKASAAINKKEYDSASSLLRNIVQNDPKDFPAWQQLATVYFIQKNYPEAETAYNSALQASPDYASALIGLGRLRIAEKNYQGAIEVLDHAVRVQPDSAQANFFLGEAYLQVKKGSLAVPCLNQALKLDPIGMADAHLRLAALYNAVGMKDKAANEYEQFLKKVPNYPDKKKLEDYVSANKKP